MKDFYKEEFDMLTTGGKLLQFPELEEGLQKKQFSISDTGVTTRVINSWEQSGLLPGNTGGKHRRFDFVEYTHLRIIAKLREFDIKLSIIKELGDVLMPWYNLETLAQSELVKEHLEAYFQFLTGGDKKQMKEIEKLMQSELVKAAMSAMDFRPLGLMVRDAILLKNHIAIMVNNKGEGMLFKERYLPYHMQDAEFVEFIRSSYVSVSISEIIKEFAIDHTLSATQNVAILTSQEASLLEYARKKDLVSLSVKYDEGGKMKLLEITDRKQLNSPQQIASLLLEYPYSQIEVKTQDRKIQVIKRTRKVKL